MDCRDISELLTAYIDDEVDSKQRSKIEAHLSACGKCREEMRTLISVRDGLRQALKIETTDVEPPPQAWNILKQRITSPDSKWKAFYNMMTKPVWRVAVPTTLIILTLGILWGTGVLPRLTGLEPPQTTSGITFTSGSSFATASWAVSYSNLEELCNSSDVIVTGTVDRVIDVTPAEWGHGEIYNANSAFKIEQVLKGTIEDEIVLTKIAIKDANIWLEGMAVDPPFEAGEKWVLFLNADTSYTTHGPWGRYKIINNKVYSMNRITGDNNAYITGQLDYNGVKLSDFINEINETLESVILTFNDRREGSLTKNIIRFDAGSYAEVNINLSTGKEGPGDLTYTVTRVADKDSMVEIPLPDEMEISIEPVEFTAQPWHQYLSALEIRTAPELASGTYWIRVEYRLGESMSGYSTLMVNIN